VGGPQRRSERLVEEKLFLPLPEFEPQFIQPVAYSLYQLRCGKIPFIRFYENQFRYSWVLLCVQTGERTDGRTYGWSDFDSVRQACKCAWDLKWLCFVSVLQSQFP